MSKKQSDSAKRHQKIKMWGHPHIFLLSYSCMLSNSKNTKNKNSQPSFLSRLKDNYEHFPEAANGLALGLCGLSSLIDASISTFVAGWINWVAIPLISIAIILVLCTVIRDILYWEKFKKELRDPLSCSFFSTFGMTLVSISGFIAYWNKAYPVSAGQIIGSILLIIGLLIQLVVLYVFIRYILVKYKFNADAVYGSWFLPSVGIAIVALNSPNFNNHVLPNIFFQFFWYIAFVTYVLLFIQVTYVLLFNKKPKKETLPSLIVYFAPGALVTASFFTTFALPYTKAINPDLSTYDHFVFFAGTWYISGYSPGFIICTAVILISLSLVFSMLMWLVFIVKVIRLPFSYMFASLTFPTAINALTNILMEKYMVLWMVHTNAHTIFLETIVELFLVLGYMFAIISTALVGLIILLFLTNLSVESYFRIYKHQDVSKVLNGVEDEIKEMASVDN